MEPIEIFSTDDVVEIISEDDFMTTSTQSKTASLSKKPAVPIVEEIGEESDLIVTVNSSPMQVRSTPKKTKPKIDRETVQMHKDFLNRLIDGDSSDVDFASSMESSYKKPLLKPNSQQRSPSRSSPFRKSSLAPSTAPKSSMKEQLREMDSSGYDTIEDKSEPSEPHLLVSQSNDSTETKQKPKKSFLEPSLSFISIDEPTPERRRDPSLKVTKVRSAVRPTQTILSSSDEDPEVSEHKILLSSAPNNSDDETPTFGSSLGSIRAAKASKPIIPLQKLKKVVCSYDKKSEEAGCSREQEKLGIEKTGKTAERQGLERDLALSNDSGRDDDSPRSSHSIEFDDPIHDRSTIRSEPTPLPPQRASKPKAAAGRSKTDTTSAFSRTRQSKADKQQQREELRRLKDVNKVNRSKQELLGEMVLEIPTQVMSMIKHKKCEGELEGIEIQTPIMADPCLSWKRKTTSEYDAVTDSFIPCPPKVIDEDKCCLIYNAMDFVVLMEMETVLTKLQRFKRENQQFKNITLIIVDYDVLIQKIKNIENRKYQERMKNSAELEDKPQKKRRKKKQSIEEQLSLKEIEDTITELQVNGFKVFSTKNVHETTVWLKSWTYVIASARYDKLERNPEFANVGTVKSGKDTEDVYFQMLNQIKFMTEARAKRVTDAVPTLPDMIRHVQRGDIPEGRDGKALMISNVESQVIKLFQTLDDEEFLHME